MPQSAEIGTVIAAIQDVVGAISGIRAAPDTPPESINQFPFAVCYPATGAWTPVSAGWMKGLHTVVIEIHVSRADLSTGVAQAMPYLLQVANALLRDTTFGGTVQTFSELRYTFGRLVWGTQGTTHIGWKMEVVGIKTEPAFT